MAKEKNPLSSENTLNESISPWKIIIADDDRDIHLITQAVLTHFEFEGRGLRFISAYSGEETKKAVRENPDTAVILLDVVMETDDAGLKVAQYIREELGNQFIRIILRTGQPGQAPEMRVIQDYDINDYKEKTELTANKLFTTVIASIRNYRDLIHLEKSRGIILQNQRGLKLIIESYAEIFEMRSYKDFSRLVLEKALGILHDYFPGNEVSLDGFNGQWQGDKLFITAGTGKFQYLDGDALSQVLEEGEWSAIKKALDQSMVVFAPGIFAGGYKTSKGQRGVLFLSGFSTAVAHLEQLMQIFMANLSIAYENIFLEQEIIDTQAEVVNTLGEVVETRAQETARHVKRVGELSYILAKKFGFCEEEALLLKQVAPMHDVGKIGIPDLLLTKPGKLTSAEFDAMKHHAQIGYEILKKSDRQVLKAAAIIAHEHHEKYDGSGYPQGLSGEEIHPYSRIVALADVFDALTHKRPYKEAWSMEKALQYLGEQKGRHFDPRLIEVFFENLDEMLKVNELYKDED